MKTIQFTLSMPNVGSWNGKWSGRENLYARVRRFTDKRADEILKNKSYYYNFGDGWGAAVGVKQIDGAESRRVSRASKGFCGYDWMIDSIVADGVIYGPTRPKPDPVKEETKAEEIHAVQHESHAPEFSGSAPAEDITW